MKVIMAHGSGGEMTSKLVEEIFSKSYGNELLSQMEDSTVVDGAEKIAITTDSFVVDPIIFRGGDIGRLAICGTVNDLAVRGAKPKYITCGFIIEEGMDTETLRKIAGSMAETAKEAGVVIAAGDTKVVEGKGGVFINTSGVGFMEADWSAVNIKSGDAVIVTGTMGDHHAAILSERLSVENDIASDVAPLTEIADALRVNANSVHAMRDVTRGGLATVLKEMAEASGTDINIFEERIPVNPSVRSFAGLMGLECWYMGNEGKAVVIADGEEAENILSIIKSCNYGEDARIIGYVTEGSGNLILNTEIGGKVGLSKLRGEGLPRIC